MFSNSFRQQAFVESPAQRRARRQFLANHSSGELKVQTWLKDQSTYTVDPRTSPVSKGHRRNRISTFESPRSSPHSSIPEDEPYVFYSTPMPSKSTSRSPGDISYTFPTRSRREMKDNSHPFIPGEQGIHCETFSYSESSLEANWVSPWPMPLQC